MRAYACIRTHTAQQRDCHVRDIDGRPHPRGDSAVRRGVRPGSAGRLPAVAAAFRPVGPKADGAAKRASQAQPAGRKRTHRPAAACRPRSVLSRVYARRRPARPPRHRGALQNLGRPCGRRGVRCRAVRPYGHRGAVPDVGGNALRQAHGLRRARRAHGPRRVVQTVGRPGRLRLGGEMRRGGRAHGPGRTVWGLGGSRPGRAHLRGYAPGSNGTAVRPPVLNGAAR